MPARRYLEAPPTQRDVSHDWLYLARYVHGAVLPIFAGERRSMPGALHEGEWPQPGSVDDRAWNLAQYMVLLYLVLRTFEAASAPPQRGL